MELPILIEPLADRAGYSARLGDPFHLHAEAATPEQARAQLAVLLQQRLRQGARLDALAVPIPAPPAGQGWLTDDELTRAWLDQVQQYRQECDNADRRRLPGAADEQGAS